MLKRCYNKTHKSYQDYGGRGILVCKGWKTFSVFNKWVLNSGYKKGLSLDRINNNKGYKPSNCRWSDSVTQCNNRRSSRFLFYKGKSQTVSQWSRELDINVTTLLWRLKNYPVEQALNKGFKKSRFNGAKITINGDTRYVGGWDNVYGVGKGIISSRICRGWDYVLAVTVPIGMTIKQYKNSMND